MQILDANGKTLELRTKLGEGGEGSVWLSPTASDLVIKTYLRPMSSERAAKLAAMTGVADATLLATAAWPTRLVYDARRQPVGFEMPRLVDHHPIHELFGTKSRLKAFPSANWALLAHAATNLAAAFAGLHARGIVVGDVNSNNIVVGTDGRVRFIDCDSFQIRGPHALFRCDVGVAEYVPHELQGVDLATVDRRPAHDAFGLAVMIFQLLFVGKHLFMGRLPNPGAQTPTIGDNISRGNYFYDETARRAGLLPPPASLTLAAVTPTVARYFEQAFRGRPDDRPSAAAWQIALAELCAHIGACALTPSHRHLAGATCPWCAIEVQSKIVYFIAPSLVRGDRTVDESIWATFPNGEVARLWAEIERVHRPSLHYDQIPAHPAVARPIDPGLRRKALVYVSLAIFLAAVAVPLLLVHQNVYGSADLLADLLVVLFGRPSGGRDKRERDAIFVEARDRYQEADRQFRQLCASDDFYARRQRLASLRDALFMQREALETELAAARRSAYEAAKRVHNDRYFLANADVKGIGRQLIARLASNGIETASDIDGRIYQVTGIGRRKAERLIEWRAVVEGRFRFDAADTKGVTADVRSRHVRQRAQNRDALVAGLASLAALGRSLEAQGPVVRARAIEHRRRLDQAEADRRAYSSIFQ